MLSKPQPGRRGRQQASSPGKIGSVIGNHTPRFSSEQELQPQTHLQIPLHRLQRANRDAAQQLGLARLPIDRLQLKREDNAAGATVRRQQHFRSVCRCRRSLMRGDRTHHDQFAGVVIESRGNHQPRTWALLFMAFGVQHRLEGDDVARRGNAQRISFPRALPTAMRSCID